MTFIYIQSIIFNVYLPNANEVKAYTAEEYLFGVVAGEMDGYEDLIIMASGSFTQGSSIEISCDGPIRAPFIAYMQGGLTYEYGKIAVLIAINNMI